MDVKEYFKKDPLLYADMSEIYRRGNADVVELLEDGVLLYERIAGTYLLAAENKQSAERLLKGVDMERMSGGSGFIVAHGEIAKIATYARFSVKHETPCFQVVYTKKEELPLKDILDFRAPRSEEIERIKRDYHRESPESIERLCAAGKVYAGFRKSDGVFVGFIGSHPEGSMGLLHVFPEYRRKGYGEELEKMLVNAYLGAGDLPYGHVVADNDVSMNLQNKLGYEVAREKVYWLYVGR